MLLPIKNKYYCSFPTNIIAQFLPILLPSSENASSIWCICLLGNNEMLLVIDIILYRKVLKMLLLFDRNTYCKVLKSLWWCEKRTRQPFQTKLPEIQINSVAPSRLMARRWSGPAPRPNHEPVDDDDAAGHGEVRRPASLVFYRFNSIMPVYFLIQFNSLTVADQNKQSSID